MYLGDRARAVPWLPARLGGHQSTFAPTAPSCKSELRWFLCPFGAPTPLPCPEHRSHLRSREALPHFGPCHLASGHLQCLEVLLQYFALFFPPPFFLLLIPGTISHLLPRAGDTQSGWMPPPPPPLSHQPSTAGAAATAATAQQKLQVEP